ncbi:MAG: dicarboxylate transporter, DctP subunit [Ramlibacter sp.]|nr:dicarboxylate transporter, DctP subunit [Ramlibacter sp.]
MSRLFRFACAAAFAFAAHAQQAQAVPVTLVFAHGSVVDDPLHKAALQFATRVEERTGGQVKVQVFPAHQLGTTNEVMRKIKSGSIDFGAAPLSYLITYEKAFALVAMPYVFDNYEHALRVLDGPAMGWLAPLAEKHGFVLLSNWEGGFRDLTNNVRPINKPEDVHGLKFRVPPVVELEATMEALGAQVTKIGFGELHLALASGVVDGQENPLNAIYYAKLHEVQRHLALTHHVYYNRPHVIGVKSWAKLTPAQQAIIREESRSAGDAMHRMVMAEEHVLLARMVAAGVKVTRPDPLPFRAATEPARRKIALFAGEENARTFLQMVADERNR